MPKKKGFKLNVADLDQIFPELGRKVKERFSVLRQEVTARQQEMDRLSQQHERLTGKSLIANGRRAPVKSAKQASAERGGRRRTRKPGVTIDWLEGHLKKPMTVRQLQEAAQGEKLSGLRIAALLKEGKGKFKSEAGTKKQGVKGKAPALWSVK